MPITLNNPIKDGYNFEGWFIDESFTGERITGIDTRLSEDDGDLYAKWSDPIEYEIAYVIDGEPAVLTPSKFTVVDNVTLAVPEMDGYTFDGWYLNDGMTGEKVTGFGAGTYAANQTFYGKWIRTYRITYVDADGLENNNPTSYTVLQNDLELQPVSKTGFKFLGWFNDNDERVESIPQNSAEDITLTAHWAEFPILVTTYGGIEIFENENGTRTAQIDALSKETLRINDDVEVDEVVYNRELSIDANTTVMFPFSFDASVVTGGKFYEFAEMDNSSGSWVFRVKEPEANFINANKPYILIPEATSLVFTLVNPVTLNTTGVTQSDDGNWHFKGTYEKHVFTEADPEWGRAYAFAGEEKNGYQIGQFHKIKVKSTLLPMRGYLVYEKTTQKSIKENNATINFNNLPEDIAVEVYNNSGIIIGDGVFSTKTGLIKMDCWYDLTGRKLNAKPTVQGTYYHNGKRVVVR